MQIPNQLRPVTGYSSVGLFCCVSCVGMPLQTSYKKRRLMPSTCEEYERRRRLKAGAVALGDRI
ncbi:MAG: hypothetical protein ACI4WZ_07300 [Eubacteriales bacterium]